MTTEPIDPTDPTHPAPPAPAAPDGTETSIPRSVKTVLAVLMSTAFVMMLNETTVAVALPSIMAEFSISAATAQWLLTGFMLTMAVVMPTTGWVLERFSTRRVFAVAVAAFLVGTVLAAIAPSFVVLLLGRVAQGFGTAIVLPLLMTVTMALVPAARRGTVMGLIAVVMAVGPALGPAVAGAVLSVSSWHIIFWVMVPLVIAAGVVGMLRLTDVGTAVRTPLDAVSVVLSVLAFGGLIYGLSSIGIILEGGPAALSALIITAVGVVGLAVFVRRQIVRGRTGQALLDLRPLAVRGFTVPVLVLLILFGAMLGVMNTLPLYLQGSLLVSALVAGLALMPGGLVEAVISPFAGRLFDRVGPRPLIIPGMVLATGSLAWLVTASETTGVGQIIAIHIIFSIGLAAVFSPLMTTALGWLPRELYSHGSAILNTGQQLAAAAGTAALIAVYSAVSSASRSAGATETAALADGASTAFLISAVLVGIALVLSLFITRVPTEDSRIEVAG